MDHVARTRFILDSEADLKILNWLTALDYGPQHSDYLRRRQSGTGQWLLDSEEYRTWLGTTQQTLFCPGMPGAGKTILTSTVINDLEQRFWDDRTSAITYVYCIFKRKDEQKIEYLITSLLKQIAQALRSIVSEHSRVFIMVDAVDECQTSEDYRARFLSTLFDLQAQSKINLFAISRVIPDINKKFEGSPYLEHALAVEQDESALDQENCPRIEHLVSVCAGLVTVDEQSGIVRLVHYAAQEYLESTKARWFPEMEQIITTVCTTYLSFDSFATGHCETDKEFEKRLAEHRLYDYAAWNWGLHARTVNIDKKVLSFLSKPAQVDAASTAENGITLGIIFGSPKLLIEKDADITAVYNDGETPLYMALSTGHLEVAKLLIENGIDVNAAANNGSTPLHWTSSEGYEGVAKLLIQKGADVKAVNIYGETPLHLASTQEVASLLIEKGGDVKAAAENGATPLHWASLDGSKAVAKLLIQKGADVMAADDDRVTPLHWSSCQGHLEVARLLMKEGADVKAANIDGEAPLHWSSRQGNLEVARLLIEKGADINAANYNRQTSLYLALSKAHKEVAKMLIEKGADVTAVANDGRTPLHWTSFRGYQGIAKLLIEKGADTKAAAKDGRTPLHSASDRGHLEVARLLIEEEETKSIPLRTSRPLRGDRRSGRQIPIGPSGVASSNPFSSPIRPTTTPSSYSIPQPLASIATPQ
ncbi:purine and uridine phosphorylase [Apiospora phragmitis]|uniref:Purine and uridine phosphorylase n=1 Tax=Apiospora phragmitis TaxID=2905665 RepID=A0ABR1TB46_9PEZI